MTYGGYNYLDLKYKTKETDFKVLIYASGEFKLEKLAEAIASESSVGTWTKISTMNKKVFTEYKARVYKLIKVTDNSGFIFIAYPYEHFDAKNILQFQASVMGNLFGLKELYDLYIMDISFPIKYQKQFKGPKFGINGIRKYLGTTKSRRPHTGTIVKPKVGLTPKEFANVAYKAWSNGLDLVKDDENLVDQKFCRWKDRFDEVMKALNRAEKITGEKKLYATNITDSDIDRMKDRVDYVYENGGKMVMMDVYVMGMPALCSMVNYVHNLGLIIHAHRAGYSAHQRGNFGVNFQVYEKFYRMIGVDQLHIGTGVGKMEGSPMLIKRFHDVAVKHNGKEKLYLGSLDFKFAKHIKPIFPVTSGGVNPGMVDNLVALHGKDIIIQAGGGVHGHPKGTAAGARALRYAVDSVNKGIPLLKAAKKNKDLKLALDKFGYTEPSGIRKIFKFEKENKDLLNHLINKDGMQTYRMITEHFSIG